MAIYDYKGITPILAEDCFIAPSADVIGDVRLGAGCSVWFGAVIRGDMAPISIGAGSNVQDQCMVHVDKGIPTVIGEHVTIGHGAIIHGATVEDHCLIGMGAIILDEAVIGQGSVVAAGAVVAPGTQVPPLSQVMGVPAKVVKSLAPETEAKRVDHANTYRGLGREYLAKNQ